MQYINAIDDTPKQKHTILLPDSTPLIITLSYDDSQYGWFMDLYYETNDFTLNSYRITTGKNILRQYLRVVPFGIAIACDNDQEPMLIEDFLTGRASFYILSADEVLEIEDYYRIE